jgi:hypothetical protein
MVNSGTKPGDHLITRLITDVPWALLTLVLITLLGCGAVLILRRLHRRQLLRSPFALLELTPPALIDKTPLATTRLMSVLHELATPNSLIDRLLQRRTILSLEVVSSRSRGIRYMLYVSQKDAAIVQQDIAAYLPGVRFKKAKDYQKAASQKHTIRVINFSQTGHPSLPLTAEDTLNQHDPIAYMTGAMTQLKNDELIVFQLLVSPLSSRLAYKRSIKGVESLTVMSIVTQLLRLCGRVFIRVTDLVRVMLLDAPSHKQRFSVSAYSSKSLQNAALLPAVQAKLSQPLFQVNVRALIIASNKTRATQRVRAIESSLASYDASGSQSLRAKRRWLPKNMSIVAQRLPSILPGSASILSVSEVAALYHFPYSATSQTENLSVSLSRSLPAPVSLKRKAKHDILLGTNIYHGTKTPIGLTAAERERHVYMVGGTGNGKTTMLMYAIEQDIRKGKGLAVIDPHGDLAESILKYIPKKRLKDVIYFNPDDVSYPVGLNLLEIPSGLTDDELLREKDLITETVISVFRKIFSEDDSGGHRIEYVLRNTIQTALTIEGATIFTIFRLLTNGKYRKQAVANLQDQDLKDFWNNEMGKAGEFQRIKMSAGITAKVGRFLFSGSARRILGQPVSTIDFDDIINSGKILICNFSKGLLGEDTASLFGITVLSKLQIATLRRARLQPDKRRPFYLYVDEFQNFATMSFVQLMSEARKYKLFLSMAEQSTSQQQEERIVNIILANVGTVICFRSASPADEQFLLPLFAPFVQAGEIAYLPPFHFYIRIAAAKSQEPFSGETIVLSNTGSPTRVAQVIESSRAIYALQESETVTSSPLFDIDDYEVDSPLSSA